MDKQIILVILKLITLLLVGICYMMFKDDCETTHESNVLFFLWIISIAVVV